MPERRQFEGKDLRDALRAASTALGIPEDRLSYEVLAGSRKGVFGFGARVRIWAEAAPEGGPLATALERSFDVAALAAELDAATDEPAHAGLAAAEDLEWSTGTLGRMVELMGFDLQLAARSSPDGTTIELSGEDRTRLLEDDGELLEAMQFVLNRIARRRDSDAPKIRLECEGFREERDHDLIELARETAHQVSLTGRARWLPPLNPYERRLVHMTAGNVPGIATESAGEGFLKRVRILPTKPAGEA